MQQQLLESMYEMQISLIEKYKPIQGLPEYPLDLKTKKAQKFLRETTGFLIEELSETFEQSEMVFNCISTNNGQAAFDSLLKYHIELADSIHFLLELLIYCGISPNDLRDYLITEGLYDENPANQTLSLCLEVADLKNQMDGVELNPILQFSIIDHNFWITHYISHGALEIEAKLLWMTTKEIYKAINQLKHKDWSVREANQLNLDFFISQFLKGVLSFFRYIKIVGLDEEQVFKIYEYKNKINHGRIKSGY